MTFKEIQVGECALRFWPSDNGWMCGITPEMMAALEAQSRGRAAWSSITEEEREALLGFHSGVDGNICAEEALDMLRAHEQQLREKNA